MSAPAGLSTLALVACLSPAVAAGQESPDWLAGCWTGQDGSAAAGPIEIWTRPEAGAMLGLGRTVRGTRSNFEFLRIEKTAQGLDYVAQPGGRPATRFASVEVAPGSIEFTNPQHDFPQRVRYSRDGETLRAELTTLDRSKRALFTFERAACDSLIP